jgi:hypothetical protein
VRFFPVAYNRTNDQNGGSPVGPSLPLVIALKATSMKLIDRRLARLFACVVASGLAVTGAAADEPLKIEIQTVATGPTEYYFAQARGAAIPGESPRIIVTMQEIERAGSHGFHDWWQVESRDQGRSWSKPARLESLVRKKLPPGDDERSIGDLTPMFHAKSGVVLSTGKTFTFRGGTKEDRSAEQVSYAVLDPRSDRWSEMRIVEMPSADHEGLPFTAPNTGCCQRVDLADGDILLPIRYRKDPQKLNYTTVVARCTFDGTTLRYVRHGSELSRLANRGYYEPSLVAFGGRYLLTLRADDTAFVTASNDGLTYEPPREWTFDDGKPLGSYNTQQHWLAHGDRLYLVYTRRGANNDHVFRHRAPLFIARIDPERLCVLRETEQVLVPENRADLGNFGIVDVGLSETWVVVAEYPINTTRHLERNAVFAAKITWPVGTN